MSKYVRKYGLFSRDAELLESFWEKDDKHALIKALCLAECDFNAKCEKGFVLARIDYQGVPYRVIANIKNSTTL